MAVKKHFDYIKHSSLTEAGRFIRKPNLTALNIAKFSSKRIVYFCLLVFAYNGTYFVYFCAHLLKYYYLIVHIDVGSSDELQKLLY